MISEEKRERFHKRVVGRSIGQDTFDLYWRWIERFESWYGGLLHGEDRSKPSLATLEDFDTMLSDPSVSYPWDMKNGKESPNTYSYRTRVIAISAVKMWLRREYNVNIPEQPDDIVLGEPESFDPTYIPLEEIEATINDAPDDCNCDGCAAALALSYDAILRAAELAQARVEDYDRESQTIYVRAVKKSLNRELSISDRTAELINDHLDSRENSSEYLFTNTYGDRWLKNSWASHVKNYHHEAGSHAFGRHSPIMHLLERGEDFGSVYRRARHSSPDMTGRYARLVGSAIPDWAGGGSDTESEQVEGFS